MRKSTEPITNDVSKRVQHFHDKDIVNGSLHWHTHSSSRTSTLFLWNQKHLFWQRHHPARVLDSRELHRIPRSPRMKQLQKADSSALDAYENINSLLVQSVFSQIGVYFIREMMSQNTRYPRQVYFKVLLSSGEDCSNVHMQIQLNFLDQESVNDRTPKPQGLRKRVLTVNENVQTGGF